MVFAFLERALGKQGGLFFPQFSRRCSLNYQAPLKKLLGKIRNFIHRFHILPSRGPDTSWWRCDAPGQGINYLGHWLLIFELRRIAGCALRFLCPVYPRCGWRQPQVWAAGPDRSGQFRLVSGLAGAGVLSAPGKVGDGDRPQRRRGADQGTL